MGLDPRKEGVSRSRGLMGTEAKTLKRGGWLLTGRGEHLVSMQGGGAREGGVGKPTGSPRSPGFEVR